MDKLAKEAVHVAGVIFRGIGISPDLDFPPGWHDEIVCGSLRRNKDGSITVDCCINVYADDGTVYSAGSRKIRLTRKH